MSETNMVELEMEPLSGPIDLSHTALLIIDMQVSVTHILPSLSIDSLNYL
jgi:hypothetical protein